MEIILRETIDTLGLEGEVVKVKPGYARNYLIPQKKAVLVTPEALAELEQKRQDIEARLAEQKKDADKLAAQLADKTFIITKRVGDDNRLFGSVTNADIAVAIEDQGIKFDKKNIVLKNPIKEIGEYKVTVKVGYQTTTDIAVQVAPDSLSE
ncbi:MAG: 50S ribosomal protein L9 [Desulfobulbus propionicus]|nr:MAG: 50S ribosomal protein L9 [Desulfobulbus propionicus]PIE60372.1 MAG: 50S ribosomal protein L9 [Desulfobulbus propionicus]